MYQKSHSDDSNDFDGDCEHTTSTQTTDLQNELLNIEEPEPLKHTKSKEIDSPKNNCQIMVESDIYHSSEKSLGKSLISWLIITLLLILVSIPLYIIMSIFIILFIPSSMKLAGKYVIFVISITILSISYILYINDIYPIRIFAFYSILPLIVSVIFKNSIIFASQIREKIREYNLYENNDPNKVIRFNQYLMKLCKISNVLFYFSKHYHIWGKTLNDYKPFGDIRLPKNNDPMAFKQAIDDTLKQFGDFGQFTLKQMWDKSSSAEKIIIVIKIISCILYVTLPAIYYILSKLIMKSHATIGEIVVDIMQFSFGIGINVFIVYSVTLYTEVIFYRLLKYHSYMKAMCKLIGVPQISQKNGKTDTKTGIDIDDDENTSETQEQKQQQTEIFLCDGNNIEVWFENWCRIQKIATSYFERKKSWIFGIMFSITLGIGLVLYDAFFLEKWFDGNLLMIYCALMYFIVVFIRLLLVSIRFSNLQQRYIAILLIQHTVSIRRRSKIIMDQDKRAEAERLMISSEYLNNIRKEIELRSVSPKIAGVSLNVALVRLSISGILGIITSLGTYGLRQI